MNEDNFKELRFMEITNFLTQSFLTTYTGTLVAVELMVFATKGLPLIKKIPTRVYTFALTIIHSVIINVINGTLESSLKFYYLLFINALVITVALCGGYDVVVGKMNLSLNQSNDEKTNDSLSNTKDSKKNIDKSTGVINCSIPNTGDKSAIGSNITISNVENTMEEFTKQERIDTSRTSVVKGEEKKKNDIISDFSDDVKEKNSQNIDSQNNNEDKSKDIIKNVKCESINVKGGLDISNYLNAFK